MVGRWPTCARHGRWPQTAHSPRCRLRKQVGRYGVSNSAGCVEPCGAYAARNKLCPRAGTGPQPGEPGGHHRAPTRCPSLSRWDLASPAGTMDASVSSAIGRTFVKVRPDAKGYIRTVRSYERPFPPTLRTNSARSRAALRSPWRQVLPPSTAMSRRPREDAPNRAACSHFSLPRLFQGAGMALASAASRAFCRRCRSASDTSSYGGVTRQGVAPNSSTHAFQARYPPHLLATSFKRAERC